MTLVRGTVVVLLLPACLAASSAQAGSRPPTLGSKSYPGKGFPSRLPGFGAVAPRLVSANGDANSIIEHVRWVGWGKRDALGYGSSYEFASAGGYLPGMFPVELRATDRGRCRPNGPIVYRRLLRRDRIDGGTAWSSWAAWPDVSYPRPQLLC